MAANGYKPECSFRATLLEIPIINRNSERIRRLSREGAWVALGQVMAVLGALAGIRVLTELLEPSTYGELALGLTLAALVNQVIFGPLSAGITRFYAPQHEQGDLGDYFKVSCGLTFFATVFTLVLMVLLIAGLSVSGRSGWMSITAAACMFAVFSGYNGIFNGVQNAARQRSIVAFHQGIEPWMRFSIAAGFAVLVGSTSKAALWGYVMASLLVCMSQAWFVRRIIPGSCSGSGRERLLRNRIWNFSWPVSAFGIFTWMQFVSDRWALEFFATTEEVGYYAVLFHLGYFPMSIATGMAVQFLGPIYYQRAGDARNKERTVQVSRLSRRFTLLALAMTCAAFLGGLFFHGIIFRIFVASEYASASYLLPWILLGGGLFSAGQIIALNLMSQMKTLTMATAKIVTALFGVALNCLGAYWYGTVGVIFAGVLFAISYLFWMILLEKRETRKEWSL